MENKKNNVWIIVLLVIIIVGLAGYICYDKFFVKEKANNCEVNNNSNGQVLSTISPIVVNALNGVHISDDELYKKGSFNIEDLSNSDLVVTAINHVNNSDNVAFCTSDSTELKETLSFEELNDALRKYVLNKTIDTNIVKSLEHEINADDVNGKNSRYSLHDNEYIAVLLYDDGVKVLGSCDGGFGIFDSIEKNVIMAEVVDDNLYIYEKVAFVGEMDGAPDYNDNPTSVYYKDYNHKEVLQEEASSKFDGIDWSLYNTYKYSYKIIEGNYYLQTVELINE